MLFVTLMTYKSHLTRQQIDEASQRRARWTYPPGLELVAEYWVQGSPQVIIFVEAEEIGPVLAANYTWADVFDINTHPALTVNDGLQALQMTGVIKRRGRRPKALAAAMRAAGKQ
jgi:hypothetical protein